MSGIWAARTVASLALSMPGRRNTRVVWIATGAETTRTASKRCCRFFFQQATGCRAPPGFLRAARAALRKRCSAARTRGCRMASRRRRFLRSGSRLGSNTCLATAARSSTPFVTVPGKARAMARRAGPFGAVRRCTSSSAENTGTPLRAQHARAVSLLPMPIEPVRPSTNIASQALREKVAQRRG